MTESPGSLAPLSLLVRSLARRFARSLLYPERCPHDLAGDLCRLAAAAPTRRLQEHGDRDQRLVAAHREPDEPAVGLRTLLGVGGTGDRKSTRLNSSHVKMSY